MKNMPDLNALEQRIRQMGDTLETPASLSPENLLPKLPARRPERPAITLIKKYTPSIAAAACLLLVMTGAFGLRTFTGKPVIQPETSVSASETPGSSVPEETPSSLPETAPESSSAPDPEPSAPAESSALPESSASEISSVPETSSAPESAISPAEPEVPETVPESSLPETAEPAESGPPDATNLDYSSFHERESVQNYDDVYRAMKGTQSNAVLEAEQQPDSMPELFARPMTAVETSGTNAGGMAVSGSEILCTLDPASPTVYLYELNGTETRRTAELPLQFDLPEITGFQLKSVVPVRILTNGETLAAAAEATFWSESLQDQKNITALSFYDISNPAAPEFLSTLCQDGYLSSVQIANGDLLFITEFTVPWTRSLSEGDPGSYLPHAYQKKTAVIPLRDQIQISENANTLAGTTFSTVDLQDPTVFSDIFCYLGSADQIHVNDQFACLVQKQKGGSAVTVSGIYMGKTDIRLLGETTLNGTMAGDLYVLPNRRGAAVTLLDEDGAPSLCLLDRSMKTAGHLSAIAPAGSVFDVNYHNFSVNYQNEAGETFLSADFSSIYHPQILSQSSRLPQPDQYQDFGNFLLGLTRISGTDGEPGSILLTVSRAGRKEVPELVHSLQIDGSVHIPALHNAELLFSDSKSGLVGFSLTRCQGTGENRIPQTVYQLYRYDDEQGFLLLSEQPLTEPGELPAPDYQVGLQDAGHFYIALPDRVLVLDTETGKLLAPVSAENK